jgi:serine/threonine-protein kinase
LPDYLTRDVERTRRFQREAHAVIALNHPNIVTVYEIGEDEGTQFIASELVKGETLRARLAGRSLKLSEALEIAVQVANALAEAHREGIVHRDIKPENIMIRPDGYVKVLDFGIAKLIEQRLSSTSDEARTLVKVETNPGMVLGTAHYMSPEQARGLPVDARTDIWSLGVVLYEMVSGRVPFDGPTTSDLIVAILDRDPASLLESARDVPQDLADVVATALSKNREDRYQAVPDLLTALQRVKQTVETGEFKRATRVDENGSASMARQTADQVGQSTQPVAAFLTSRAAIYAGAAGIVLVALAANYFWRKPAASIPPRTQIESIAVLPFKPLVTANRDEALEMGMADTIINRLSGLHDPIVRPLSAVRSYANPDQDAITAGRALRVDAVLDGSIARAGDRVRVTARLLRVADGQQLWSDTFDESFTDIFTVEDRVSEKVAGVLVVRLNSAQHEQLTRRYTENTEAYQAYLKGRYNWNKRTADGYRKGIDYFRQALSIDPNYALAYAGLADSYNMMGYWGTVAPREAFPKAKEAANRALAMDDTLAEAHASLGYAELEYDWDFVNPEKEYRRALELSPNYATAHLWYAEYLNLRGRHNEASAHIKQAQDDDPISQPIVLIKAWFDFSAGQYDQAIEELQKTIEMDPNYLTAYDLLVFVYIKRGMADQAIALYEKKLTVRGSNPETVAAFRQAYKRSGLRGFYQKDIELMKEESKRSYISPIFIAMDYAELDDKDQAFAWLDKAVEDRSGWLLELNIDPTWNNLRADPRFADLVARIGVPSG